MIRDYALPKFSDNPEQNAEMTAEYLWDCRIAGENPYGGSSYDDDPDYDDYDDYDDEDEE
jgi:hypothetical protein